MFIVNHIPSILETPEVNKKIRSLTFKSKKNLDYKERTQKARANNKMSSQIYLKV